MEQTRSIPDDDSLIDDEIDENEEIEEIEELDKSVNKIQAIKQTWRDIEIQRELKMLERQLGEKLDKDIFN